jgi:hypothetical protein
VTQIIVSPKRDEASQQMLDTVACEVHEQLRQSLHVALDSFLCIERNLSPNLELQSRRTAAPLPMRIKRHRNDEFRPAPKGTSIQKLFEKSPGYLFIVGEAGSGKTTSLLEIAQGLVSMAIQNPNRPIPVLLNLSSWAPNQSILDWAAEELNINYGLWHKQGKEWLRDGKLYLLLDGLDEVKSEWQSDIMNDIQLSLNNEEFCMLGLVICCRMHEFNQITGAEFDRWSVIHLSPLDEAQISAYLTNIGLSQVADRVNKEESLQEILSQPLFLSVFGLVASRKSFNILKWREKETVQARQEYLLDRYWKVLMQRTPLTPLSNHNGVMSASELMFKPKSIRCVLSFAAQGMGSQYDLRIEGIQPSWLPDSLFKWEYRPLVILCIGLLSGGIINLFAYPTLGLMPGLISGFVFGAIVASEQINPYEKISGFTMKKLQSETNNLSLQSQDDNSSQVKFSNSDRVPVVSWLWIPILVLVLMCLLNPTLIILIPAVLFAVFVYQPALEQSLGNTRSFSEAAAKYDVASMIMYLMIDISIISVPIILVILLADKLKVSIRPIARPNQLIKYALPKVAILACAVFILLKYRAVLDQLNILSLVDVRIKYIVIASYSFGLIWYLFQSMGIKALIQHLALRFILLRHGYAPVRYDHLLNYCAEHLLLQRVGGRYRFMHRTLQNYFSAMRLDK